MDQQQLQYLIHPPSPSIKMHGLPSPSESSNSPSPLTKPIGFANAQSAAAANTSPLRVLASYSNDYDMINKGAAKTMAGGKVSQQMDKIRKLRLKTTLNEATVLVT